MYNAKNALNNRLNFGRDLIKNKEFSFPVYCYYFEIPYKTGTEDIKRISKTVKIEESKQPISLQKLREQREQTVQELGGEYTEEILEQLGLWHIPKNIDIYDIPKDLNYAVAFLYSKVGMRTSDIVYDKEIKKINDKKNLNISKISIILQKMNAKSLAVNQLREFPTDFFKLIEMVSKNNPNKGIHIGYDQRTVILLTGLSEETVLNACSHYKKNIDFANLKDKEAVIIEVINAALSHKEQKEKEIEILRNSIFAYYTQKNMKEGEIGKKMGYTRQKINYEISTYRVLNSIDTEKNNLKYRN